MALQSRPQAFQNRHSRPVIRFFHRHRAETPFQSRVFFNVFPVLFPGSCTQHLQFPSAQCWLKNICRINGTLRCAGPNNGVHFIHEENHISAAFDFLKHIPQAFLKLAPVLGACHQIGHIQTDQPLVLQLRWHIPCTHSLGKSLGNGRLSHPRFSHQRRIVLVLST